MLGWGKKPTNKQEEEDMTMEEILASIRRYVTEDQPLDATTASPLLSTDPKISSQDPKPLALEKSQTILPDATSEVSRESIAAAANAFSKLEEAVHRERHPPLEELRLDTLIVNLARPMIEKWLDHNLPQIVESIVEKEIQRIRDSSS